MDRRAFLTSLGLAAAATQLDCASVSMGGTGSRRLRRTGIQLYTLRDDARRDLARTLADIAAIGYKDVELYGLRSFGLPPERIRSLLDSNGLRAPSTHVGGQDFDDLDRQFATAATLGHKYIVLASIDAEHPTLDDYRRWADRLNEAGRLARTHDLWIAFHDEAPDFPLIDGQVPYDVLVARTDPSVVRLQLDTGNAAIGGRDPIDLMKRYGPRYFLFHIKDAVRLGSQPDTELGKGIVDFKRLLGMIDDIDNKYLYVEQESYPGAPLDSARRDYQYISTLEF
jgi:sugar phosphate isomerase/epimerase